VSNVGPTSGWVEAVWAFALLKIQQAVVCKWSGGVNGQHIRAGGRLDTVQDTQVSNMGSKSGWFEAG
jgi:hypothetical protein